MASYITCSKMSKSHKHYPSVCPVPDSDPTKGLRQATQWCPSQTPPPLENHLISPLFSLFKLTFGEKGYVMGADLAIYEKIGDYLVILTQ